MKFRSSVDAILLILAHEQLRLIKYKDVAGYDTIGWGHKITESETISTSITRVFANKLFTKDLYIAECGVAGALRDGGNTLNSNQFGALVCLTFNIGVDAFRSSSVVKAVNNEQFTDVPNLMKLWNKFHNKQGDLVLNPELVLRRQEEAELFATKP